MNNMGKVEKIVQSAPNGIITAAQLTKAGLGGAAEKPPP